MEYGKCKYLMEDLTEQQIKELNALSELATFMIVLMAEKEEIMSQVLERLDIEGPIQ